MQQLTLTELEEIFAICRLPADASIAEWALATTTCSITRTPDELSVVCPAAAVPDAVEAARGWRGLKVEGPLDLALTGVAAALTRPLAEASVPVLVISTYDTDYLLVPADAISDASAALERAGHVVRRLGQGERVERDSGDAVSVTILRAGRERIADLAPLWRDLHEHHMAVATRPRHLVARSADESWARRRAKYERWLAEPDAFLLLAERDGRALGYAVVHVVDGMQSWQTGDRVGELETLTLLEEARGEGTGARLMEAIDRELHRLGIADLVVAVAAGNDRARRFYERRGFTTRLHVLLGPVSSPDE